jgi:hypothetical protein
MKRKVSLWVCIMVVYSCTHKEILYQEDFSQDLSNWAVEQMPDGVVDIKNGHMNISQQNGAVVWFKKKLKAPVVIEYDITVVDKGGKNDRVADMNCFWMANDPKHPSDFFKNSKQRSGKFSSYFPLSLYYVGYGGHNNTKTRYRKHLGNGQRDLLPEHDLTDDAFRIVPNKKNKVRIEVDANGTQFFCNNKLVYDIADPNAYLDGYFGIRSYKNHLLIDNFLVTKK